MQPMLNQHEIKDLRILLGLKKTELAAKVGVSENTVHQWEIGRRRPSGAALILLHQLKQAADKQPA